MPPVGLDTDHVRLNTWQDDYARTSEGARRTGGVEIFAKAGMGKPPRAAQVDPGFRRDEVAATGKEDYQLNTFRMWLFLVGFPPRRTDSEIAAYNGYLKSLARGVDCRSILPFPRCAIL
jgi:hypothetical protein